MPTPTYDLIQEQRPGLPVASITFSSIPGTYKDLVLEIIGSSTANASLYLQVNGDTAGNYSSTVVGGDGSAPYSNRYTNTGFIRVNYAGSIFNNTFCAITFMSYANTNINKTVLARLSTAGTGVDAAVGLWRSTNAITSITAYPNLTTFTSGSTFRLWGVAG